MPKKKIMLAFGTRPEAIKMAPLYHGLKQGGFNVSICVTAQHREMLDQVLDIFSISPDIDMNLMKSGQDLTDVTTAVLKGMKAVIRARKPDVVLVHGDTTTAMAVALACFYKGIDVGHVEAGLRTYNIHSPFPEEFNRQTIGKIARWHFCPTQKSADNLIQESVKKDRVFITGNTVIDALFYALNEIKKSPDKLSDVNAVLNQHIKFDWQQQKYVLITAHRRENFGKGIIEICQAIKELSKKFPDLQFIYPVHPNPNIKNVVEEHLTSIPNIHLLTPLSYQYFTWLMKHAYIILTDSGGIQEEAPSLGVPVLVMRSETERPEALEAKTCQLVGSKHEIIVKNVSEIIENPLLYEQMSRAHNPYGDGTAVKKIINVLS